MSTAAAISEAIGQWKESFFAAADGTQLFHASLVPSSPRATVVFVHGYDDHAIRYRHVFEAFAKAGFAVHALDVRGHGHSSGRRGFVAHFSDYADDLNTFIARVRAESGSLPLFIVAHSNGCLITGTLLISDRRPKDLAGVVLSSPYYQLKIAPSAFQLFQAKVVGKLVPFLPVKSPISSKMLTHDPEFQRAADADPLKHRVVTPRWFTESNAAQADLQAHARDFTYPLLVMIGTEDAIAHPDGGRKFYEHAGSKDKHLVPYEGMFHEIFMEVDRAKPIGETIRWIESHLATRTSPA